MVKKIKENVKNNMLQPESRLKTEIPTAEAKTKIKSIEDNRRNSLNIEKKTKKKISIKSTPKPPSTHTKGSNYRSLSKRLCDEVKKPKRKYLKESQTRGTKANNARINCLQCLFLLRKGYPMKLCECH